MNTGNAASVVRRLLLFFGLLFVAVSFLPGAVLFAEEGFAKVNQVLIALQTPKKIQGVEQFELTEAEVNSWAEVSIQLHQTVGLKAVEIDFQDENRIGARALINMDEVSLTGITGTAFKSLLEGEQVLEAVGLLGLTDNKAVYTIESAQLNGVAIPAMLANAVLSYISESQPPHIDVTEPFNLPFGLQQIRTSRDSIELVR